MGIRRQERRSTFGLDDDPSMGDVWTFCAIDADTKLVPAFMVGKRDKATANAFVAGCSGPDEEPGPNLHGWPSGLRGRDREAFGSDVDYAQIIKTYGHQEVSNNRRYSAPDFVSSEKESLCRQSRTTT